MKKVHIALVGGQPVPVYIGINYDNMAAEVILVRSSQTKEEADRIKDCFPARSIRIEECSPVDLYDIENLAIRLKDEFADCEIMLNLTSGTKPWTLSFFRVFSQLQSSRFIYVDQTNTITDFLTKETCQGCISHFVRFQLYGTPLKSYISYKDYDDDDIDVMKQVESFRRVDKREFTQLTGSCDMELWENGESIPPTPIGSNLEYDFKGKWVEIELKGRVSKLQEFSSPHVFNIVFNSGWFELKVAHELSKSPHVKDVWLNCEFLDSSGEPKNEIDIIADLGNRLLFVECKTMIKDTTDIDKFRSALRNFSGTSTTGLFVTNDKPKYGYGHAVEKCKDNGILTFNFALWRENPLKYPTLNQIIENQLSTQHTR